MSRLLNVILIAYYVLPSSISCVTNFHEPRIELWYQSPISAAKGPPYVSLSENAPKDTHVAIIQVADEDRGPAGETTLSIERGNDDGHFKLAITEYTKNIIVDKPFSHNDREFNLTIVARDHGSPPKSSSTNLVIKIHAAPNVAPLRPQDNLLGSRPAATDLIFVGTVLVLIFTAVVILLIFGCALVQRLHPIAPKGQPPTRTTSASNSRIITSNDQCTAFCITNGYNLNNLQGLP